MNKRLSKKKKGFDLLRNHAHFIEKATLGSITFTDIDEVGTFYVYMGEIGAPHFHIQFPQTGLNVSIMTNEPKYYDHTKYN